LQAPLWWTVKISASDPFNWSTPTGLVFNTVSDKVAPEFLVQVRRHGAHPYLH
jgi:hypothetical protein